MIKQQDLIRLNFKAKQVSFQALSLRAQFKRTILLLTKLERCTQEAKFN
jgi:hypothetical protein